MLVADLIRESVCDNILIGDIKLDCSDYLNNDYKFLLTKYLPNHYSDIQKVKVRLHKEKTPIDRIFNCAFEGHQQKLIQRSVITNTKNISNKNNLDEFCVFPINGYKFLYNKEITNSNVNITNTISKLNHTMINTSTNELVIDLLKSTYSSNRLHEAIMSQSEIIIYNIPYYYVIRKDKLNNFKL